MTPVLILENTELGLIKNENITQNVNEEIESHQLSPIKFCH